MDAFEQVVSEILRQEGFWVRTSVKVKLTQEDKAAIERSTSPRWELDVVAYRPSDNLLWVVECKSFFDSPGVGRKWLEREDARGNGSYKLFVESKLRKTVLDRLGQQFTEERLCLPKPKIQLCLACGKIQPLAREPVTKRFQEQGWKLLDEEWLRDRLLKMTKSGYENQVSTVVVKMLREGAQ